MTLLSKCIFEFIGTMVMILLGDGVVACNVLNKSKGQNCGWVVVTLAWGFAVMCGVFIAGPYSGAHLNPAVTLGFAIAGMFPWNHVLGYTIAQMLGAFVGSVLVYAFYKNHFDETEDVGLKLIVFCNMPAIMKRGRNVFCEALGTWLLVFVILFFSTKENIPTVGMGDLSAFPVTMLIMSIGMSLGGTTGYALNPARDLAPRCAHALLPIKGKGNNGWHYSWVPVVGPIIGSFFASVMFVILKTYVIN